MKNVWNWLLSLMVVGISVAGITHTSQVTPVLVKPVPHKPTQWGIMLHIYQFSQVNVDHLKDLGVSFVRVEIPWDWIERTKNEDPKDYDWASTDVVAHLVNGTGVSILWVTADGNSVYGPRPTTNYTEAYIRFHKSFETRYKTITMGYEIANEPNTIGFWGVTPDAHAYAQVVQSLAPALKAVDPNLAIFGGNTSGIDLGYLSVATPAIASSITNLNVHPYRQQQPPETVLGDFVPLYAYKLPLAITEWGYDQNVTGTDGQADYTRREVAVVKQLGVEYFSLYAMQDTIGGDCACGILSVDGTEKPSYDSYKNAIK